MYTVQFPVQETVQEIVQETVQETVQEPVEEIVQEPVQETVQEPVQETVQETVQEPVQETVQETVKETVQETVHESVQLTDWNKNCPNAFIMRLSANMTLMQALNLKNWIHAYLAMIHDQKGGAQEGWEKTGDNGGERKQGITSFNWEFL